MKLHVLFKVFLTKSYVAKLIPVAIGPLIQFILKPLKKPCLMPSALDKVEHFNNCFFINNEILYL